MLAFVAASILLLPIFLFTLNKNLKRKLKVFIISFNAAFNFIFRMESEERLKAFKKIHTLFPKCLHIDFLSLKVLLVYDPDIAKRIFNCVQTCERPYRDFVPLTKGLLFSSYTDWKQPRKHLNVAFNLNVLKGFIPIFSEYSKLAVKELENQVDGDEFDLQMFISRLTYRTVSATMLNVHRVETSAFDDLFKSISTVSECLFTRMCNVFYHPSFIYKLTSTYRREKKASQFLIKYGNDLIDEGRMRIAKSLDHNQNQVQDEFEKPKVEFIIDQLINHESKFTDNELRDHLLTLKLTASDTTTNLVLATLLYISMFPDVQQKVVLEMNFTDAEVDYEQISALKYLDMVIKETLRLFGPIPMMMRYAFEHCDLGTGKRVKAGTKIFFFNYVLHQRRDIWGPNSNKFDPENFSPEKIAERDAYAFVPFGMGSRNCIGYRYSLLASKVFLYELLKAYKFSTKITEESMRMKLAFVGKLSSKYLVSIARRDAK